MAPIVNTRGSRLLRTGAKLRNLFGYRAFLRRHGLSRRVTSQGEEQLNAELSGYPSNHGYSIHGGKLVPGFQLYERWREIEPVLPERLDSFLDIGCCRGFYVLQAAQRPQCRLAVGVDVYEPFVAVARKAGTQLGLDKVAFHTATVDQLGRDPAAYGGPFQTTLMIGTYHYVFWGSGHCGYAMRSHERILACLADLTTERLILSGRLELDRLPSGLRKQAYSSPEAAVYNTDSFLQAAERFFDIRQAGFLGSYPLLVMTKQAAGERGRPTSSKESGVTSSAG
jgi:SAM-dependent methyltransferase